MLAPVLVLFWGCGAGPVDVPRVPDAPVPAPPAAVAPDEVPADAGSASEGDVFGFDSALRASLATHTSSGPSDLRALTGPEVALPFDPMKARYLDTILQPHRHGVATDTGLDAAERAALRSHGFVVSERLADTSFAASFLDVYQLDQPVFISADSVLHAWHRSFDDSLKQLEVAALIPQLAQVLVGMRGAVPTVAGEIGGNPALSRSLGDADVFLAVAQSLLAGTPAMSEPGEAPRIQGLLDAIASGSRFDVDLFGRTRQEDFSQFKPRGHYTESEALKRYFRTMVWLGREDMRVGGPESSPRELAAALVLQELLERSGQIAALDRIDRVVATFVGPPDSMTFADLAALRTSAGVGELGDMDDAALSALSTRIRDITAGTQLIQSHPYAAAPDAVQRRELPHSFTFLGQRFTVDGWATSQLVYDRIQVNGELVERVLPSGLDVAFTVLHDDAAAGLLADRIESTNGQPGRDGLPIATQLLAVRDAVEANAPTFWKQTAYGQWMLALRALSVDPPGPTFSVGRTAAWRRRVMQGQLASWAELRHDTILYVKEPETMGISCAYPAGYVEPNTGFWQALASAARSMAMTVGTLATVGTGDEVQLLTADREFFNGFADIVDTLAGIATSQAHQRPLQPSAVQFLKDVMVEHRHDATGGGCGGSPAWTGYTGWYPKLYIGGADEALDPDALVADVHSSEGANLLVATAAVDRLVVVVNNGPDVMAYSGPVSSYYEWAAPERLTDLEWQQRLAAGKEPAREGWTEGWLVPAGALVRRMLVDDDGDQFDPGSGADHPSLTLDIPGPVNFGLVHARVEQGDEAAIGQVVQRREGMFRACAEASWKMDPGLRGRVSLGWSIHGGTVSDVHVVSNATGHQELAECVTRGVRALRFSPETDAVVPEWGVELGRL